MPAGPSLGGTAACGTGATRRAAGTSWQFCAGGPEAGLRPGNVVQVAQDVVNRGLRRLTWRNSLILS
jgi:hypothetical protein